MTALDEAYEQAVMNAFNSEANAQFKRMMPILYTPLHGAGLHNVKNVLYKGGFQELHIIVEAQCTQDGGFATVSAPNRGKRCV